MSGLLTLLAEQVQSSVLPAVWPLEASVSPSVKWAPPCFSTGSLSDSLGILEDRVPLVTLYLLYDPLIFP